MTRDEAKQLYPIIQAFADGKTIEHYDPFEKEWVVVEYPAFGGDVIDYRIKAEPKYRPFKDVEECWQEMQKHQPFGWLKDKEHGNEPTWLYSIKKLVDDSFFIEGCRCYWAEGFNSCTFADGEPFGIKED